MNRSFLARLPTLEQMLDDLRRACNVGSKKNSKGLRKPGWVTNSIWM
jgi:hypothetical protein